MSFRVDHVVSPLTQKAFFHVTPSEFKGSVDELQYLESLPRNEKIAFIEALTPRQRRELTPLCMHLFYMDLKGGHANGINVNHFEATLEQIPAFPDPNVAVDLKDLLLIFMDVKESAPQVLKRVIGTYSEVDTFEKLEKGLKLLIDYANGEPFCEYLDESPQIADLTLDSDDEIQDETPQDNENDHLFSDSIKTLLQSIIPLLEGKPALEKAEHLKTLAEGGVHCNNGMLTQCYKVFLELKNCATPYHQVLKSLHDFRDGIVDNLIAEELVAKQMEFDDTVEDKSDWIENHGKKMGLLLASHYNSFIDYEKWALDPAYKQSILEKLQAENEPEEIETLLSLIEKQLPLFLAQIKAFNNVYTEDRIINYLQSSNLGLVEWFLKNTPLRFLGDDLALQNYIQDKVLIQGTMEVSKPYLLQMLDEMGILIF